MNWKSKTKWFVISIIGFSIITSIFTITAYADTPAIPQWIKNNAKWWSDGSIPDAEFLKGIQYLVQHGMIQVKVPVTEVTATNGNPSDNDRVMSMVVHFKNIGNVNPTMSDFTINTIQRIYQFGQTTTAYSSNSNTAVPTSAKIQPEFQLADLPSKDKTSYYQWLHASIDSMAAQTDSQPTADITIDLYTGDGTLLNSLEYDKCNLNTYSVYTQDSTQTYTLSGEKDSEFIEYANFVCQGFHLIQGSPSS